MPTVFADAVGQTPGAGPVGHSQAWMPQRLTLPTSNPGRQNASAYSQRGRYLCSATLISLIMSENVKHQAEPMCQASSGTAHHVAQPACENFLYGFKAARRAARAANTARSPLLPLALPQRRRQRRSAGRENTEPRAAVDLGTVTRVQPRGVHAPAAELSRARQNPSRPSVTAGQPLL